MKNLAKVEMRSIDREVVPSEPLLRFVGRQLARDGQHAGLLRGGRPNDHRDHNALAIEGGTRRGILLRHPAGANFDRIAEHLRTMA